MRAPGQPGLCLRTAACRLQACRLIVRPARSGSARLAEQAPEHAQSRMSVTPAAPQAGKVLDLPVYFGDAGSPAVLHSVGAHRASCAVVTLDSPGANYRQAPARRAARAAQMAPAVRAPRPASYAEAREELPAAAAPLEHLWRMAAADQRSSEYWLASAAPLPPEGRPESPGLGGEGSQFSIVRAAAE